MSVNRYQAEKGVRRVLALDLCNIEFLQWSHPLYAVNTVTLLRVRFHSRASRCASAMWLTMMPLLSR